MIIDKVLANSIFAVWRVVTLGRERVEHGSLKLSSLI